MNNTEKIIKATGIALAIFLIVCIVGFVLNISGSLLLNDNSFEYREYEIGSTIYDLKIEANSILEIRHSDHFKVETNKKNINVSEKKSTLEIKEKNHFSLFNKTDAKIIIYIPSDYEFRNVEIEWGAGILTADYLKTKELEMEIGAGLVTFENLVVLNNADIDVGTGNLVINNIDINKLDLEVGAGKGEINGILYDNSDISVGIGKLELKLTDIDLYNFRVNKGIGEVIINDEKLNDSKKYGNGNIILNIKNGIGSVIIEGIDDDIK